jgi:molybdate transport system substrate-binding protein
MRVCDVEAGRIAARDRESPARLRAAVALGFLLVLAIIPCAASSARAEPLRIAVAGNFTPVLERLAPAFEASTGHDLALSSGSTGKLYAQIRQGAPFDVFLAADAERPEALEREGLGVPGSRVTYAIGKLVLWAPGGLPSPDLASLLNATPPPRVALANPRVAPFGVAAEAWLRQQGAWDNIGPTAVRGENVAQAFQFTASGNADLGLVALGQLRSLASVPGDFRLLPASSHPVIEQQAVLLRESPAGRDFMAWLTSDETRRQLVDLGYDSP